MRNPVVTKEYKNHKEFEKDAAAMLEDGYVVQSVHEKQNRAGCMRWLALGMFALVFKPKPTLVVVYALKEGE